MAISKRLRFEVLRRDDHTCQYCGERAPDVTLHVDHVVPVALGGTDDPGNLVAACRDCNAGKTSVPADAPLVQKVNAHAAAYALTLTDKMTRIRAKLQRDDEYIEQFLEHWNHWVARDTGKHWPLPDDYKDSLRRWASMGVPPELIEYAVEVAMKKQGIHGERYSYMAGVIWRTLDDQDTPYNLTEETVAVWTPFEHEEYVTEERIKAYTHGWDTGYSVGYGDHMHGFESRIPREESPHGGT